MFRNSGGVGRRGITDGGTVTYHPWQRNETQVYTRMHASQTPLLKLARTERNVAIGPGERTF
jgi:hypothetical protein